MPRQTSEFIIGDVTAVDEATVNSASGSLTATLRRSVRAGFENVSRLASAAFRFDDGTHAVLLTDAQPVSATATVRISHAGHNRFLVERETGEEPGIDDLTAALVQLRRAEFRRGLLDLPAPVDAEGWARHVEELHRR